MPKKPIKFPFSKSVDLSEEQAKRLQRAAEAKGMSANAVIRQALDEYLFRWEKERLRIDKLLQQQREGDG